MSDLWLIVLSTLALATLVGVMLYDNGGGLDSPKSYDPPQVWRGVDP